MRHKRLHSLLGDEVDTPKTSVRVVGEEVLVRVGEVVGRDDVAQLGAQQWRGTQSTVPVSEHGAHDQHGPVVRASPSDSLHSNGDVQGVHGVVSDSDLGTGENGGGSRGAAERNGVGGGREGTKVLLGELDELLVGDSTGSNKAHSVGSVVGVDEVLEVVTGHVSDVGLGAEDGVPQRLTWEVSEEVIEAKPS
jgi:hypothetical protein